MNDRKKEIVKIIFSFSAMTVHQGSFVTTVKYVVCKFRMWLTSIMVAKNNFVKKKNFRLLFHVPGVAVWMAMNT